eukprot:IDg13588t1
MLGLALGQLKRYTSDQRLLRVNELACVGNNLPFVLNYLLRAASTNRSLIDGLDKLRASRRRAAPSVRASLGSMPRWVSPSKGELQSSTSDWDTLTPATPLCLLRALSDQRNYRPDISA